MSEEELDEKALAEAKSAFINSKLYTGIADVISALGVAILAYRAAAPKPAPERVGITEEERRRIEISITTYGDACFLCGCNEAVDADRRMAKRAIEAHLDSLTTPHPVQGFEPDWSKAPSKTLGVLIRYSANVEQSCRGLGADFIAYIPRPAPAKLTAEEIEEEAHLSGLCAVRDTMASSGNDFFKDIREIYRDAYLAKKAELTALDGSPRP